MKSSAIKVTNLSKSYGDLTVFKNINLEITKSEIVSIVGGSGCGKSTLMRLIIGLEYPDSGQIEIFGKGQNSIDFIPAKRFGVMFQYGGLFSSMTLAENIKVVLESFTDLPNDEMDLIAEIKLDNVGLNGFQDYYPAQISGGMKKRLAIARAMALDPEILFLDEPSSGLDPITSASIDNLIKKINASLGTTIVIISHDLASILNVSSRIIMLDKSIQGILADDIPDNLIKHKNKKVFDFFNRVEESK